MRSLEVKGDSAHGALLRSKTKKTHVLPRPRACPRLGVTGSTEWVTHLLELHIAKEKQNGPGPSFVFPTLDHRRELKKAEPSEYVNTRRKLALNCTGLNDPEWGGYTLHPPKNFRPTAATQMNFQTRELNVIDRWPSNSRMGERYNRSVCVCVCVCVCVRTSYSFATQ